MKKIIPFIFLLLISVFGLYSFKSISFDDHESVKDMVFIEAIMKAKAGKEKMLLDAFLEVMELTQAEEGNIAYNLHRTDDGGFFLYEVWRTQEDLDIHLNKPYIKDLIKKMNILLDGKNDAHFGKIISLDKTDSLVLNVQEPQALYIASIKRTKQGKEKELRASLLALVKPTNKESGNIAYNIYEEKDGAIFLFEVWKSKEDIEAHFQKSYVKEFKTKAPELLTENKIYFSSLIPQK